MFVLFLTCIGLYGNKDVEIIPKNDATNIESNMNQLENSNISGDRAVDFFVMQPKEKFFLDWSNRQEGNKFHTVKIFLIKYKANSRYVRFKFRVKGMHL